MQGVGQKLAKEFKEYENKEIHDRQQEMKQENKQTVFSFTGGNDAMQRISGGNEAIQRLLDGASTDLTGVHGYEEMQKMINSQTEKKEDSI